MKARNCFPVNGSASLDIGKERNIGKHEIDGWMGREREKNF